MYLNRCTTQTSYFNYSDSGRNLLKATEQNTECIYTRFMHKRVFSCDNYMFRIFYVCEDFIQLTLTYLQQHLQLHVIFSHSRKVNSKTLPETEVCSFKNKGRVILKLKLIYLNESKQRQRPNTSSFVPIACDLHQEYSKKMAELRENVRCIFWSGTLAFHGPRLITLSNCRLHATFKSVFRNERSKLDTEHCSGTKCYPIVQSTEVIVS